MNSNSMPRIASAPSPVLAALLLSLALILPACSDTSQGGDPLAQVEPAVGPPPLEGAALGGDFELVDGSGDTVRWTDFDGQYRIVYFGFTNCPDICPTDVQRTMAGLRRFAEARPAEAARVQPIFVSVDPARDGPEQVEEFAAAFHERLIGLTGSQEQVDAAARAFGVAFYLEDEQPGGGYNVQHARYTTLFSPEGEPLVFLPADEGADAVALELARWVR